MKKLALLLVLVAPAVARADLPVGLQASGGMVYTGARDVSGVQFDHFTGPALRAGIELGDRFTNQFAIQATESSGSASTGFTTGDVRVQTLAFGYTLNIDLFGKRGLHGFTPFLGGGLYLGAAHESVNQSVSDPALAGALGRIFLGGSEATLPYLELHAELGARYTFQSGVGVLGELAYSTYGGYTALQPSLSVAYTF